MYTNRASCFPAILLECYPLSLFRDLGWMSLEELPEGLFDDVPKLQTL